MNPIAVSAWILLGIFSILLGSYLLGGLAGLLIGVGLYIIFGTIIDRAIIGHDYIRD